MPATPKAAHGLQNSLTAHQSPVRMHYNHNSLLLTFHQLLELSSYGLRIIVKSEKGEIWISSVTAGGEQSMYGIVSETLQPILQSFLNIRTLKTTLDDQNCWLLLKMRDWSSAAGHDYIWAG